MQRQEPVHARHWDIWANVLPARPAVDGLPAAGSGRRPADVWLPRGASGGGEALDFAVTSAMQSALFRPAVDQPDMVFQRYEQLKREYKQTARSCEAAGFKFVPMLVLEAHGGGWSGLARGVLGWVAQRIAIAANEEPAAVALRIAQRVSISLHRENARAALRRAAGPEPPPRLSGWEDTGGCWQ